MTALLNGSVKSIAIPERERSLARRSSDAIARFDLEGQQPLTIRLENQQTGQLT